MATTDPIVVQSTLRFRTISNQLVGIMQGLDVEKTFYTENVAPHIGPTGLNLPDTELIDDGQPITSGRPQLDIGEKKELAAAINAVLSAIQSHESTLIKAAVNPRNPFTGI